MCNSYKPVWAMENWHRPTTTAPGWFIFDPHFQRRETVLHVAQEAGFREGNFFGGKLAYMLHLEKPAD